MIWLFALVALVAVVLIGLVVVGGETARLATVARLLPAALDGDDVADAVPHIAVGRLERARAHPQVMRVLLERQIMQNTRISARNSIMN